MNEASSPAPAPAPILPLSNMTRFLELIDALMNRRPGLPGIGVWFGPSGYGKTTAATWGAHRHRAYYLEVGESWSKTFFMDKLLIELGQPPGGTYPAKVERAIIALKLSRRPLVIDEVNHIVNRKYTALLRELYDKSQCSLVLIGLETLPHQLQLDEQEHNRVMRWQAAEACALPDAAELAKGYAPGVTVAPDLLEKIIKSSGGVARRIAVNLNDVWEYCRLEGLSSIDAARWADRPLFTGRPPAPRRTA